MQKLNIINIVKFIFKSPRRFFELMNKIFMRFFDKKNSLKTHDYINWLNENLVDFESYAKNIDESLWNESMIFSNELEKNAKEILAKHPIGMGGGGIYPLIYFVTRYKKPNIAVETGVATGYSSQTFLSAMEKNGCGKLYSSDFPYFRIKNPEKYIGILVDEKLKYRWKLFIEGDKINLPKIIKELDDNIDLFHFDSDKSYEGRIFATNILKNKLAKNAIVFYDDINDNTHFYDYVAQNKIENFKIFKFMGKYIGMIGNL